MAIIRASSHYDTRGQCYVRETAHDSGFVEIVFTRNEAATPFASVTRQNAKARWRLQGEGLSERQFRTKQNAITAAIDHAARLTAPRIVVITRGVARVYSDRPALQVCVVDLDASQALPDLSRTTSYGSPDGTIDAATTVLEAWENLP